MLDDLHTEKPFEIEVCEALAAAGWIYADADNPDHPKDWQNYDRELALYPADVIGWLKDTQPKQWAKLQGGHNGEAEKALLRRLVKLLDKDGSLSILRHGFKDVAARFDLCQFKPTHGLNPETLSRYGKVRLRVVRQVRYSTSNENSIDLVLFVNGIPVATLELKTDFTQSVRDAIDQYRKNRPPKDPATNKEEPLLAFKRRALVHFAVSTDEVHMATELRGKDTVFLPFNLGDDGGKGNPPNPEGYRTAYLWERILARDAFLDILGRFVHLEKKEDTGPDGKKLTRETLIFPRLHQWDAVTRIIAAAGVEKAGHNYLIQHSAGSGKTNSISWLAHQLASLHDAADRKVFDSVIVITDRTVLDAQLQEAIYQIEHKHGVVTCITGEHGAKSGQLVTALADKAPIIIVTLQTFPFVLEAIRETTNLKERSFAVIADEAHSSQSGAAAKKLRKVLTAERIAEIEDGAEPDIEELLLAEMADRKQPANISYFAFTATPKAKTLELFGRPGASGLPEAFHVYTMQQAIEEGFILDVLKNYTPYRLAFKLAHDGREYDDKEVEKSKALKSLMRWVDLHPYNIAQKVEVIVEHFRANIGWRLQGKAKAMVVTGSRKEAVRYKLAIDRYIADRRYDDVATLVAFSGDVTDPDSGPDAFNEINMNPGLKGRSLREAFGTGEYQIMLVANKFQTGFDQPLLTGMYVDKKLAGVAAVQTLSRLNRTHPGKTDTFVLDFVNDPDEILKAFQPYYRTAELSGVSDPNLIHDLQSKLDAQGIYLPEEIEGFVRAYFDEKSKQSDLQARLAPAVERFHVRYKEAKKSEDDAGVERLEVFRRDLGAFVRAYDFLSQIVDYGDTDLEKRSIFFKHLAPLIAPENLPREIDLSTVLMTHYNLKDLGKRRLTLQEEPDEPPTLKPLTDAGTHTPREPEKVYLSAVIKQMNDLFEGKLTDADLLNYAHHIRDKMLESDTLATQAAANRKDQFGSSPDFRTTMMDAVIAAYENHKTMSEQVMRKEAVQEGLAAILLDLVYQGFEKRRGAATG